MRSSLSMLAITAVALWTIGCGQQQPGTSTVNVSPGTTTVTTTGGSPPPAAPGAPAPASPAAVQHKGHGVVQAVDKGKKKVTIKHEALPTVPMDAMTMEFDAQGDVLATVEAGDTIDFILETRDGSFVVVQVQKAGGAATPGASPAAGSPTTH